MQAHMQAVRGGQDTGYFTNLEHSVLCEGVGYDKRGRPRHRPELISCGPVRGRKSLLSSSLPDQEM